MCLHNLNSYQKQLKQIIVWIFGYYDTQGDSEVYVSSLEDLVQILTAAAVIVGTGQPQTNIEPKLMESSITSAGLPGRAQSGKVFSALKLLTGSAASSSHLKKHLSSLLYLREDAQWNIYHAEIALGRRVVHLEQVQVAEKPTGLSI